MAISPWAKGQLSPSWTIQLTRDNNTTMDLTGVTANQLSLQIYNASYVQIATGAGTFGIVNVRPGVVRYNLAAADVATAGNYYVRVAVNFGGSSPDMSDYIPWVVQA